MAIEPIKKVHILGHRSQQGDLVAVLQRLGVVEVRPFGEAGGEGAKEPTAEERSLESRLRRIDQALRRLRPHFPPVPLSEKIFPVRPAYGEEELLRIVDEFDLSEFLSACDGTDRELEERQVDLARLEEERRDLTLWSFLDAPPDLLHSTGRVEIVAGRIPHDLKPAFIHALEVVGAVVETAWEDDRYLYGVVICLKACGPQIHAAMSEKGFQILKLPELSVTPAERIKAIDEQRMAVEARMLELRGDYATLAARREEILVLRDLQAAQLDRLRAERVMGYTRETFSIEGWVAARRLPELRRVLERRFTLLGISDHDPDPLDRVPVILENAEAVRPFGLVVDLYGLPRYGAVDPSAILAAFFALFFGLCLTDAGYGLFLAAVTGTLLIAAPRPPAEGTRRFLKMFFLCGLATVAVGAMAGGWFGLPARWRLFDPLEDLMLFFALALGVGTLHLFAGLILRMTRLIRGGDLLGAVVDQGLWMVLILALYGVGGGAAGLFSPGAAGLAKACAVASTTGIVFFQGRPGDEEGGGWSRHLTWLGAALFSTLWLLGAFRPWSVLAILLCLGMELLLLRRTLKRTLGRIGLGLYALYGITGYLSDVLSYSRLVALGLGTGIVALVVNKMAGVALGAPVVGVVLAAAVLVVGHLFNVLINLLGAFVHSCRLQYVEFFTKFYESGGRAFSPFRLDTRYITMK